jgi:hypothetical protein
MKRFILAETPGLIAKSRVGGTSKSDLILEHTQGKGAGEFRPMVQLQSLAIALTFVR